MTAQPAPPPPIVDMEARFAADASGEYLTELQTRFQSELANLKRQLAAGLAPDEFAVANQLKEALEAADVVVTRVWDRQHRS